MEWVETTGKTLEEAKEAALDELGVDEQDAEFEILQEPKLGLFGRVRAEGRVRARVRPTTPRAKQDRRRRGKGAASTSASGTERAQDRAASDATDDDEGSSPPERPKKANGGRAGTGSRAESGSARSATSRPAASRSSSRGTDEDTPPAASARDAAGEAEARETETEDAGIPRTNPARRRRGGHGRGRGPDAGRSEASGDAQASDSDSGSDSAPNGGRDAGGRQEAGAKAGATRSRATRATPAGGRSTAPATSTIENTPARSRPGAAEAEEGTLMDVALEEQGRVAETFLHGLVDAFGLTADIAVDQPSDDTLDIRLTGDDLGILIGAKGITLLAIQDLTRTVVQHKTSAGNGRIHVDVSGYRQQRSAALGRFAQKVAADAVASGHRVALEPMTAPDRKVVHDSLTEFEGVSTVSEGEDPNRRVVIVPNEA